MLTTNLMMAVFQQGTSQGEADRAPLLRRGAAFDPSVPSACGSPYRRGSAGLFQPMGAVAAMGEA